MNSPFVASAISRRDGSPADGIHLLWTAPPRIGYSIDGFDIQRRLAERRDVLCYSLTDPELATLHAAFRVRVPPGLVRVRRTKCPQFPQQGPDEPAPVSRRAEDLRTDFRKLPKGTGPNPRTERTGAYVVRSGGGRTAAQTTIRDIGAQVGLDCGFRLEIDLPEAVEAVELLMVRFAHPPRVIAFRHDGSTAATASMSGAEGQPQTILLKGSSIRRVVVEAPQNELLLLDVGLLRASGTGSHGQPSRFPQPLFRLGEVSSPSTTLTTSTLPACRVYDIRLNDAHLAVRVSAKLPAMLAVAMREGKAVSTEMLSAAGGEQSAFFQNRVIDQVLVYATTAAASLVICTDRLGSPEDDDSWKQVPLLEKNIHVPVRAVNAALGSVAAEDGLGSSRLLPGESFDSAAFHDVATLMNDSALDAVQTPPPARSVLTRETLNDPFIEIHGWQYALSLLVEADWRRMLGFGYFDKGEALTPDAAYDYRITGRFRRRELHEKLLGFHTIPLGTSLPTWFQLAGVGVGLPGGPVPSRGLFAVVMPDGAGYRLAIFRRPGGSAFDEAAASPLPPGADPAAAPLLLIVTAFDDRLRGSVGDTSIEIERDDLREGRACLIADGAVRIQSLKVTGLDIYRFPFQTSRYRSFGEHIQSFDGAIDVIEPDALGPDTTVSSVAALLSATSADLTTAMQPDADPAARQALFARWIGELGLPLKDEVNALEVSRFVAGGMSGLLLFESPEPMDFSEEIRVQLSRRDHGPHPPASGTLGDPADRIASRKARSRDDLLAALALDQTAADRRPPPNPLLDVTRRGTDLDVRLNLSAIGAPAAGLLVVEAAGHASQRRLVVYSLRIPRGATGEVTVRAVRTDEIVLGPGHSALVLPALAVLAAGTFALVTADLSHILGTLIPGDVWTAVPLRLIQDAAGLRALLIPATGATHSPLVPGSYRLTLTLDRQRWPTVDTPDEVNRYTRTQTLQLILE